MGRGSSPCRVQAEFRLLGSPAPEAVDAADSGVITVAMLEEEEQLEAAGLEQERKMLEKVSAESGSRGGAGGKREVREHPTILGC